jgi:hypothetical protein
MKIQVNSDKTIAVDAGMTGFVEGEVNRVLGRFAGRLTRVEVHLSDIDSKKSQGQADKRCLIEARPAGSRPLSATALAPQLAAAVGMAAGKMQRSLTTFFGRQGRPAAKQAVKKAPAPAATKAAPAKKAPAKKAAAKKVVAKKVVAKKLSPRGPKKKGIYQARRKAWPKR